MRPDLILEGTSLRLRPLERSDIECWRSWINDAEIAAFVDRILPVSGPEHDQFFQRSVIENTSAIWYAIERLSDRRYVGNIWLWNINTRHRNAEVRIIIGEREAWNSGVGSESLNLLSKHAFSKLGLHKLYAYTMSRNPRALRAFHKAGFVTEAELEHEVFWDGAFENVFRVARRE